MVHVRRGKRNRLPPQAIVSTEFKDYDRWMERKNRGQTLHTVRSGIAANAHVDNVIVVSGSIDQPLEVVRKALAGVEPESGGETISERRDDGTRISCLKSPGSLKGCGNGRRRLQWDLRSPLFRLLTASTPG
jgi:hypothetical protein